MNNLWFELNTQFLMGASKKDIDLVRLQIKEQFDLDLYQLEGQIAQIDPKEYDHPSNLEGICTKLKNLREYLKGIDEMKIDTIKVLSLVVAKLKLAESCLEKSSKKNARQRNLERIMGIKGFRDLKLNFVNIG